MTYTDKKFWVLWQPDYPMPPKVKYDSLEQARKVAESMAKKEPGKTFYVMEATAAYLVSHNVTATDLLESTAARVQREVDAQRAAYSQGYATAKPAVITGTKGFRVGDVVVMQFPWKTTANGRRVKLTSYNQATRKWNGTYEGAPGVVAGSKWSDVSEEYLVPFTKPRAWGPGFVKCVDTPVGRGAVFTASGNITIPAEAKFVLYLGDNPDAPVKGLMALEEAASPFRYGTASALGGGYRVYAPVNE